MGQPAAEHLRPQAITFFSTHYSLITLLRPDSHGLPLYSPAITKSKYFPSTSNLRSLPSHHSLKTPYPPKKRRKKEGKREKKRREGERGEGHFDKFLRPQTNGILQKKFRVAPAAARPPPLSEPEVRGPREN